MKFFYMTRYIALVTMKVRNRGKVISLTKAENGYDAILQCFHCGHQNHIKGLRSITVQDGVIGIMGCRKCYNFSAYVFDESKVPHTEELEELFYNLLFNEDRESGLRNYLQRHGVGKVIIYGLKYAGYIEQALDEMGIRIVCGVDREYLNFKENRLTAVDTSKI